MLEVSSTQKLGEANSLWSSCPAFYWLHRKCKIKEVQGISYEQVSLDVCTWWEILNPSSFKFHLPMPSSWYTTFLLVGMCCFRDSSAKFCRILQEDDERRMFIRIHETSRTSWRKLRDSASCFGRGIFENPENVWDKNGGAKNRSLECWMLWSHESSQRIDIAYWLGLERMRHILFSLIFSVTRWIFE